MVLESIMALIFAADQAAKAWIEADGSGEYPRPLEKAGGRVMLYRNHNEGFPFGLLKEKKELTRMLPMAVTSMLTGIFLSLQKERKRPMARLGFALVIGGSASNLYDRYTRRYVVDYFSLQFGVLKKVVFNLGDIFVFLGAGILAVLEVVEECGILFKKGKFGKKKITIDEHA